MTVASVSDAEFRQFQRFLHEAAGISLSATKKALIEGRLARRLEQCKLRTYSAYLALLSSGDHPDEAQVAVDLLTTNETYLFREPAHFRILEDLALEARRSRNLQREPYRVWSAASSSGEEAYSIGMVLADRLGALPWEVFGSDISQRVLERARAAHYSLDRTQFLPEAYRNRYCLKGVGPQQGTLLVQRSVRDRVSFAQVNLNDRLPNLGCFDVVFLRNVLIYFDAKTKEEVITRLVKRLRPGGHLFIGHSESLNNLGVNLQPLAPAVFRKPTE